MITALSAIRTPVSASGQVIDTVGVALAIVVIAVAAFRLHRRTSSWIPIILPLTTVSGAFMEPIYNVSSNLWYFRPGQSSLYSSFGIAQPIWMIFSYGACYGGLGLLIWWRVESGDGRRELARLAAFLWAGFVLLEIVNIRLGTYEYFGPQPIRVAHFPLWISLSNVAICMALGIGAAKLGPLLPGGKVWSMLFFGPLVIAAGLIGTGFPTLNALHTSPPHSWLVYLSVLWTTALAGAMIWFALQCVPERYSPSPDGDPTEGVVPDLHLCSSEGLILQGRFDSPVAGRGTVRDSVE